jgi:hypothetical protein
MARRVVPGGLLPGTQALSCIGNCIVRLQSLLAGVEEMHAPRVGVAMLRRNQQIAVRRPSIDAGQHGRPSLEDLVVQTHANARQVLAFIDNVRLSRGRLKHIVNGAQADRYAQQVAQKLDDAAIRAVANQRQRHNYLTQPCFGDRELEQPAFFRRAR